MGIEKDFAWSNGCMMKCADDVLLSCILETCMVLWTNVTPVNSIFKKEVVLSWQNWQKIKFFFFFLNKHRDFCKIWTLETVETSWRRQECKIVFWGRLAWRLHMVCSYSLYWEKISHSRLIQCTSISFTLRKYGQKTRFFNLSYFSENIGSWQEKEHLKFERL